MGLAELVEVYDPLVLGVLQDLEIVEEGISIADVHISWCICLGQSSCRYFRIIGGSPKDSYLL